MKFSHYLFNTALNGYSIAIYKNDSGNINLVIEVDGEKVKGYIEKSFNSSADQWQWIEGYVDDADIYYHNARALNPLLQAMRKSRCPTIRLWSEKNY